MTSRKQPTSKATKTSRTRAKTTEWDAVPIPIHWIAVEVNHIPQDILCLVDFVNTDGMHECDVAYKSKKTKAWTSITGVAIEEDNRIVRYAVITDEYGHSWPIQQ